MTLNRRFRQVIKRIRLISTGSHFCRQVCYNSRKPQCVVAW